MRLSGSCRSVVRTLVAQARCPVTVTFSSSSLTIRSCVINHISVFTGDQYTGRMAFLLKIIPKPPHSVRNGSSYSASA